MIFSSQWAVHDISETVTDSKYAKNFEFRAKSFKTQWRG